MLDSNWDLIDGEVAHEIEVLNYSSQINVLEALLKFLIHHHGVGSFGCNSIPNVISLREIHRTGTLFLLQNPGEYRQGPVVLQKPDGSIVYNPPESTKIDDLVTDFFQKLGEMWRESTPVEVTSFCLWNINWIHPFKNGNGRAARAFAYCCLCLKYGFMLPGSQTVIDLIMKNKPEYEAALRESDTAYEKDGTIDLSKMNKFVERLLIEQLSSTLPVSS